MDESDVATHLGSFPEPSALRGAGLTLADVLAEIDAQPEPHRDLLRAGLVDPGTEGLRFGLTPRSEVEFEPRGFGVLSQLAPFASRDEVLDDDGEPVFPLIVGTRHAVPVLLDGARRLASLRWRSSIPVIRIIEDLGDDQAWGSLRADLAYSIEGTLSEVDLATVSGDYGYGGQYVQSTSQLGADDVRALANRTAVRILLDMGPRAWSPQPR